MYTKFKLPVLRLVKEKVPESFAGPYDIVVKLHQDTINTAISSIYKGTYPQFLKESMELDKFNISMGCQESSCDKVR